MVMEMKNRSHRHEIVPGLDIRECKNCLSIMMLIYKATPEQHLKVNL